jgi:hypothetical protein
LLRGNLPVEAFQLDLKCFDTTTPRCLGRRQRWSSFRRHRPGLRLCFRTLLQFGDEPSGVHHIRVDRRQLAL